MKNQKSANFYRGAQVQAKYHPTQIPDYDGNPLIEALPQIMSAKQAASRLSHFPKYNGSMRQLNDSVRYHLLRTSPRFFTPLGIHIDLERRISCAVRMSLVERNPIEKDYWIGVEQNIDRFLSDWIDQYNIQDDYISTYASGFNFVGISGSGKSQTIQRILGTYPQVIFHSNYMGREFAESQLVWLKLDCPFDGSIKALCLNFFQAVDAILGTNYLKSHAGGRRSANEMIPLIATVAANHHLGVLVIDEIQRLNQASSGGKEEMLNFFVQLVNTIGVAVVLVGTFKALELLNGTFSQMRRGTGQGDLVWDRMSFDKNWERFIKSLWKYQFTRRECVLEDNPELSRVLYDECQGITDLAIKAYMFAQERAIETGKEYLNASVIRSAARDKFQIIRPAIEAFRNKQKEAIKEFEDAYPTFLEKYMDGYTSWSTNESSEKSRTSNLIITGEITREPEIKELIEKSENDNGIRHSVNGRETNKVKNIKNKRQNKSKPKAKGILPSLLESSAENGESGIYDALANSGFTNFKEDLGFNDSPSLSEGGQI